MIVNPLEASEALRDLHTAGLESGDDTGWPGLDEHYTVVPGQWTLVTGIPSHGKSEFLDALCVNLARQDWCFMVFSPENWPIQVHIAKLLEKWTRQPFFAGPDRLSEPDAQSKLARLQDHFEFIVQDSDAVATTIPWIITEAFERIDELRDRDRSIGRARKYGLIIDPWNEVEHQRPEKSTETEYISYALSYIRQHCRQWSIHAWVVAHPKMLQRDKDGKRPVPTPYDISGSANWYNKSDNIITVWRDVEDASGRVEIHVQKVRFRHVGRPGMVELTYDRATGTYSQPLMPRSRF